MDDNYKGHDDEQNDEDYLKDFISGKELGADNNRDLEEPDEPTGRVNYSNDFEYEAIPLEELPCGIFYPDGMRISVRAAKVSEIQAYSVVANNNIYDITEKMNDMLKSCTRVILANGKPGSYYDIKDADRVYLIFYIRERTFQSGNNLNLDCECKSCGHEYDVNLERKRFDNGTMPDSLAPYFDSTTKMFHFNIKNGDSIKLGMPTIGIQKHFYEYIKEVVKDEKTPNMSYLKTDPFLIPDRSKISKEGIKKRIIDFKKMNGDTYQFIKEAIDMIDDAFGIKNVKSNCSECDEEVHSKMKFPGGVSALFSVSNAFDRLIKK